MNAVTILPMQANQGNPFLEADLLEFTGPRHYMPGRLSVCSTIPGREIQRSLVRSSVVHRFAVGNDHPLERKLEQRSQRGEDQLIVPGRRPHPKLAFWRGERVSENERALLRQPERRLIAPSPVI